VRLILHHWQSAWCSVTFDTDRGTGSVRWLRRAPDSAPGWAYRHEGRWYAIWCDGSEVLFQAGAERWPMTDDFVCLDIREGRQRVFSLRRGGGPLFEVHYQARDRDRDPTFDETDLELEDFFVFAARRWRDAKWKQAMAKSAAT